MNKFYLALPTSISNNSHTEKKTCICYPGIPSFPTLRLLSSIGVQTLCYDNSALLFPHLLPATLMQASLKAWSLARHSFPLDKKKYASKSMILTTQIYTLKPMIPLCSQSQFLISHHYFYIIALLKLSDFFLQCLSDFFQPTLCTLVQVSHYYIRG